MLKFFKGKDKGNLIYAPCKGRVVPLAEVPDPVFADKVLGDGFAVIPADGRIYAPADGEVAMVFDTLHAVTLTTDLHINMLHVGIFVTVFSTLGAVIDTALSVTSSVYEVWTHKNSLTAKELTASGYQVGKEIIGTTVNTLLFAYLGGTILLFSYIQTQQYSLEIILNSQFLFQDVAAMLSGAVACLITVPVSIKCIIRQIS